MDDTISLRLVPHEDGSGSDEEIYRALASNERARSHGPPVKNRRFPSSLRRGRSSIFVGVLTISLLANLAMIFLLLKSETNMNKLDCSLCNMDASEIFPDIHGHIKVPSGTAKSDESPKAPSKPVSAATTTPLLTTTCPPPNVSACPIARPLLHKLQLEQSTKKYDNIFADLSSDEIIAVYKYLVNQQALHIQDHGVESSSHIYAVELHTPNKSDAINYIDDKGPKPAREARVVIERLDLPEPVVEEYVVGPLPVPTYHQTNPRRLKKTVDHSFLPTYGIKEAYTRLAEATMNTPGFRKVITDIYGTFFIDCGDRCLMLLPQRTSSAYSDRTLIVLTAYYATDFVTINPVDLMFVMKESRKGSRQFEIDSIFHNGQTFKTIDSFLMAPKSRKHFPEPALKETSIQGTMNSRGRKFPAFPQAGPKEYQPEGNRYILNGQHVQYLEWSFNMRMSTASGPQVWDVSWAGERIAYEISLQDVGVIYAGANPTTFYAHLSDSAFGLGDKAYGLVPGADCPEHATFIPQTIYSIDLDGPQTLPNAFCLFEHNTGVPLRRHRSNDAKNGRNYGGLLDRVLIVRTIIVEYNYDYIFDFVFHQNGALELKTYATGYVMSQTYTDAEAPFGFRIHNDVVGSIHHHLMNFKIDLDIQGTQNRYETLDFVVDDRHWPWHGSGTENFQQLSFKHNLKHTEQEAILHYNFSKPKYYVVHNEQAKNKFGNPRGYRITTTGFSKQILPDESPVLKSRKWSKYQMLATKRKDEEESSSSIFSMFDGNDPHVDIDRYLQDNENIVDQDLVFWLSVGFQHIPHTEDIPNTPTVGAEASISLLPYNYFPECPSISSDDAIRLKAGNSRIVSQDQNIMKKFHCLPNQFDYSRLLRNISLLFI